MNIEVAGRYQLTVRRGGVVTAHTPWFDNLITDIGLDRIGVGEYLPWCALGTGSTPPAYTDTVLETLLVAGNNLVSQDTAAGWHQRIWTFPAGTATGLLTEVGVGWDAAESSSSSSSSDGVFLFSRALLPAPLDVGSDDVVTVAYELTLHPPAYDEIYQIAPIGGVLTTCTARAAYVGDDVAWGIAGEAITYTPGDDQSPLAYDGTLGEETSHPSGNSSPHSTVVDLPYIPGTHYLEQEGRWNLDRGNFAAGISAVLCRTNGYGAYQIGFDPPLVKVCYDTLKLIFRVSWERYLGSSSSSS